MTTPAIVPVQEFIPQQNLGYMICLTCNRYPWDCACARNVECSHCEIEQQDAKYLEAKGETHICPDSPNGLHVFVSTDPEP